MKFFSPVCQHETITWKFYPGNRASPLATNETSAKQAGM